MVRSRRSPTKFAPLAVIGGSGGGGGDDDDLTTPGFSADRNWKLSAIYAALAPQVMVVWNVLGALRILHQLNMSNSEKAHV